MNDLEKVRVDKIVRQGLRPGPGQSLHSRASQIIAQAEKGRPPGNTRVLDAALLLLGAGEPWERMRLAAARLCTLHVVRGPPS